MARLIIGHVTDERAKIWVRGDRRYSFAQLRVWHEATTQSKTVVLEERHGYTGVAEFRGLSVASEYQCEVQFSSEANSSPHTWVDFGHCRGRFRTAPPANTAEPFSFLLGSCNLHSLGSFSSPDRAYEELLDKATVNNARFMVHCGDQIYYDIPNVFKSPDIQEYRDKYLDAWGDSRPTRHFLTQLPHYMILDDHEITDNFANDFESPNWFSTPQQYRQIATKVYREFVHIRQPDNYGNQALYYRFSYGNAHFFVLDTRTDRFGFGPENRTQLMGDDQLRAFKSWLSEHKNDVKFVVTSVPFVGEVRNSDDKWSAPAFKQQKDSIVDHIAANEIGKLIFLTGDMHNSYHGTMRITGLSSSLVVHELMSSPINQLHKTSFDRYISGQTRTTESGTKYKSVIKRSEFYSDHSNAMVVAVDEGEVKWEIFRTKRSRKVKSGSFAL
jgi:phosphodiesterase/alkaline phosphatase D-like protein